MVVGLGVPIFRVFTVACVPSLGCLNKMALMRGHNICFDGELTKGNLSKNYQKLIPFMVIPVQSTLT